MPMPDARSSSPPADPRTAGRTLLVSGVFGTADAVDQLGSEAYSYHFVYRAFAPLLRRLGDVVEVDRPESRLDYAIRRARSDNCTPVHLSFRPLQSMYLSSLAPNVAFPFWEFPDIPDQDLDGNPRNNWLRIANHADRILCASEYTRSAFSRAGVRAPVHVVPVPVRGEYYALPARAAGDEGYLDCAVHLFPREPRESERLALRSLPTLPAWNVLAPMHAAAQRALRATLPAWLDRRVGLLGVTARARLRALQLEIRTPSPSSSTLGLSGVVYTSLVNPFDRRKNWEDLLSAFLIALREQDDATLVLKLVLPAGLHAAGLQHVLQSYYRFNLAHRCKLAVVTDYLSDHQMIDLARWSTYYVTAARAEGACLPVQDFLAAGRPVISPCHSALSDYLDPDVAFIVDSHPEPTSWPHDPTQQLRTTWHRLVWQALHDRIQESYRVAKQDGARYERMAQLGRDRMNNFASADRVWPRLRAALDDVTHATPALR